MDSSLWQRALSTLQNNLSQLEQSLNNRMQRFSPFRTLFTQLIKTCDKFASAFTQLADNCDQQILTTLTDSQQSLGLVYVNARNSFLGVAQAWRIVAIRSRNQIVQPMKVFSQNYKKVGSEVLGRLKQHLGLCLTAQQQIVRSRESYYTCCQKLERHKESQAKIMMRIENGQPGQLEKFNRMTKNLLEKVSNSQRKYMECVQRGNYGKTRNLIDKHLLSLKHNQTARVQFLKKISQNQLRLLELGKKLNLSNKQIPPPKLQGRGRSQFTDAVDKVQLFSKSTVAEIYVSHEQLVKSKKHKQFQQQNPVLMQLFNKVKESQKNSLLQFVHGCLQIEPACHLISLQKVHRNQFKMVFPPEWQTFRQKILSLQHYNFYFSYLLNRQLNELPNYYIKLSPPFYQHLLTLLIAIILKIQLNVQGTMGDVAVGTCLQVLKLAERVVQKKQGRRTIGNMKVMIEGVGICKKLRDQKILYKLLKYLIKKGQKKRTEPKGVMSFTKGLLSTFTGKKQQSTSTDQEQFNALVQLTHIMANLSLPTELTLPFLKNILKNSGQTSYQYLKDILQGRRDRQQRQILLFEYDQKSKLQKQFKQIIQKKKQAVVCIRLTAEHGFLNKQELQIRLCCKQLQKINYQIIFRLPIELIQHWKWICNPSPAIKYQKLQQIVKSQPKKSDVQQIIQMDVNRSLHLHSANLSQQTLKNFLVFYARDHPQMSYCQGMNYLGGYLLLKLKNESISYSVFCHVMQKYFTPIFINSFGGMKLKLYIYDRLFSIFHSDLSDHFKRQMITPECYLVGWVITAFTSVYQYTQKSFLVDWFWERFVLWGWKQFYRLTMWLLQIHREQLLSAGYDRCLQILGDIPKSKVMLTGDKQIFLSNWKGQLDGAIEGYSISDQLLQKLTQQFSHQ